MLHMQSVPSTYICDANPLQVTLSKGFLEVFISRKAISEGNYFSHVRTSFLAELPFKELSEDV